MGVAEASLFALQTFLQNEYTPHPPVMGIKTTSIKFIERKMQRICLIFFLQS